jgi:hypothetical protein
MFVPRDRRGWQVYTMLQDANSISSAQKVPSESFQRLSVSFACVCLTAASCDPCLHD